MTSRRAWTDQALGTLASMWREGRSSAEIGLAVDRTAASVQTTAFRSGLPARDKKSARPGKIIADQAKRSRLCMMCGRALWSSDPGYRICPECKQTEISRAA